MVDGCVSWCCLSDDYVDLLFSWNLDRVLFFFKLRSIPFDTSCIAVVLVCVEEVVTRLVLPIFVEYVSLNVLWVVEVSVLIQVFEELCV